MTSGLYVPPGSSGNCSSFTCPAGFVDIDSNSSTPCIGCFAPGLYVPAGSAGSCASFNCSIGWTDHDFNASSACIQCSAGTYVPAGSAGPCVAFNCSAGWIDNDQNDTTQCIQCSSGQYVPPGSSGNCSSFACAAGTTDDDSNPSTPCRQCIAGEYTVAASNGSCSNYLCIAGTTDNDSNPATACISCSPGTYLPVGSFGNCSSLLCPAGSTDSDLNTTTPCTICSYGTYAPAGSTLPCASLTCNAGAIDNDYNSATPCVNCSAGTYVPAGSAGTCASYNCSTGTIDNDSNPATACVNCSAGSYVPSGSFGSCSSFVCPAGTTDADMNPNTPCVACGRGTYVPANSSGPCPNYLCKAGATDLDSNASTACVNCSIGSYAGVGTFGACPVCQNGTTDADSSPSTPCILCSAGQYTPSNFSGPCPNCSAGTSDDDFNPATPCINCSAGEYVPSGSVGQCNSYYCAAGTVDSDLNPATPCLACSGSTNFTSNLGVTACQSSINCNASQFQASPATATSNRVCQQISSCDPFNQYVGLNATATSDRICLSHVNGLAQEYVNIEAPISSYTAVQAEIAAGFSNGSLLMLLQAVNPSLYADASLALLGTSPLPTLFDNPPFGYVYLVSSLLFDNINQVNFDARDLRFQLVVCSYVPGCSSSSQVVLIQSSAVSASTQVSFRVSVTSNYSSSASSALSQTINNGSLISTLSNLDTIYNGVSVSVLQTVTVNVYQVCFPCGFYPNTYQHPQCAGSLIGVCANCTICAQGTYQSKACVGSNDTVCTANPTFTPQLSVSIEASSGYATSAVQNASYNVYTRPFTLFAAGPVGSNVMVQATVGFGASVNQTFGIAMESAVSFNAFPIDRVVYYDSSQIRVVFQVQDADLNVQTVPATMFLQASVQSSNVTVTCITSSVDGTCVATISSLPWGWLNGGASSTIVLSGGFVNQTASQAAPAFIGNVSIVPFVTQYFNNSMVAYLPGRPLYAGDTFTATVIGHANQAVGSFAVQVVVDANLQVVGFSSANSSLWTISQSISADSSNGSIVGFFSNPLLASTVPLVDSMYRQLDQPLFQVTFAVRSSAAVNNAAVVQMTIQQYALANAAQPILTTPTPVMMFDRSLEADNSGRVLVIADGIAVAVAFAQQGQFVNVNMLNPTKPTSFALSVEGWTSRYAVSSLLTSNLLCSSNVTSSLSVASNCSFVTVGNTGSDYAGVSGVYNGNITFSVTARVWVPTLPLNVSMNAQNLLMFYGFLAPEFGCQPRYTQAKLTALTTFVTASRAIGVDVTPLVQWSLASSNTAIVSVLNGTSTITGQSFGTATVSFLGNASSGISVTVASDTQAFVIGVDVTTIRGEALSVLNASILPLSTQAVTLNVSQGALMLAGEVDPIVASGVIYDPIRNVQYRQVLQLSTGLNISSLNTSIAASLNSSVMALSSGNATVAVMWGGGSCPLSSNYTTFLQARVSVLQASSIIVSPGTSVIVGSSSNAASLAGLPSQVAVGVVLGYSNGVSQDFTLDPRTTYTVSGPSGVFSLFNDTTHQKIYIVAGSTAGTGVLTIQFAQDTITATVTVSNLVAKNFTFNLAPYPSYNASSSVSVSSLALIASSTQYQAATPVVKMALSDNVTVVDVSLNCTFSVVTGASKLNISLQPSGLSVIYVKNGASSGSGTLSGSCLGSATPIATLTISASTISVKSIGNLQIVGFASNQSITLSGTASQPGSYQLVADVTLSDGTVLNAAALFGSSGINYANLINFVSSQSGAATINSNGVISVINNSIMNVAFTVSSTASSLINATLTTACNLAPNVNDVDLGSVIGNPINPVALNSVFSVSVRINTAVLLAGFLIDVNYDTTRLQFVAASAGGKQGGGIFDASAESGTVSFGGLSQVSPGAAQEIAVLVFTAKATGTATFSGVIRNTIASNLSDVGAPGRVIVAGAVGVLIQAGSRRSVELVAEASVPLSRQADNVRRGSTCSQYPLGDADESCAFDLRDVLFVQSYVLASTINFAGTPSLASIAPGSTQFKLMDADQNGVVNTQDVIFLNSVLFQLLRFVSIPTITPVGNPTSKCLLVISTSVSQNPSRIAGQDISKSSNTLIYFDIRSTNPAFQAEFTATFSGLIVAVSGGASGLYGGVVAAQYAGSGVYQVVVNSTVDVGSLGVSVLQVTTNSAGSVDSAQRYQLMTGSTASPLYTGALAYSFTTNGSSIAVSRSFGYNPFSVLVASQTTLICQAMRMPQNLAVTAIAGGVSMMATWSPPQTPPYAVAGYLLMYRRTPFPLQANADPTIVNATVYDSTKVLNVTSGTSTVVVNLQPYIFYDFQILAYTVLDGNSFIAPQVTGQTAQAAPTLPPQSVAATTLSSTQIQISWQLPYIVGINGIITSYVVNVTRLPNQILANPFLVLVSNSTNVGNVTSFVQSGLEPYIQYSFTVLAVTVANGVMSAPAIMITNQSAPDVPPALALSAVNSTAILATWVAPPNWNQHGPLAGYFLQYQRINTIWSDGTTLTSVDFGAADDWHNETLPVVLSFTITGLLPDLAYSVQVLAFNYDPYTDQILNGPFCNPAQHNTLEAGLYSNCLMLGFL